MEVMKRYPTEIPRYKIEFQKYKGKKKEEKNDTVRTFYKFIYKRNEY